jgi:hypothetical protein
MRLVNPVKTFRSCGEPLIASIRVRPSGIAVAPAKFGRQIFFYLGTSLSCTKDPHRKDRRIDGF